MPCGSCAERRASIRAGLSALTQANLAKAAAEAKFVIASSVADAQSIARATRLAARARLTR